MVQVERSRVNNSSHLSGTVPARTLEAMNSGNLSPGLLGPVGPSQMKGKQSRWEAQPQQRLGGGNESVCEWQIWLLWLVEALLGLGSREEWEERGGIGF